MDQLNFILARRSIRRFKPEMPGGESIARILAAACAAPSANNSRPWNFRVIEQRTDLDRLAAALPYGKALLSAPCAILVCGRPVNAGKEDSWWVQGCSAATQNALLAIHALGLGGVWLGLFPREERCRFVREHFGLPQSETPFALVALGWSNE